MMARLILEWRETMKRMLVLASLATALLVAPLAWAGEEDELNEALDTIEALVVQTIEVDEAISTIDSWFWWGGCDTVDIYDIFARSLTEVDLDDDDIQFFVDRLPYNARVFLQTAPDGTRTYTYMTATKFGCIAKILPAVPGVKPQLYMHIEDCKMSRHRKSGKAVTNYIHHTIHKADGTQVKEFYSTATWTFHHVNNMMVTAANGEEYDDIWLVETLVVNTPAPSMVQYYTVEGVGIVGKRLATVSW